jgi:K+-transporting ATPase KdpF subunit
MVTFHWIGGLVALALLGYLFFALLRPEKLQ